MKRISIISTLIITSLLVSCMEADVNKPRGGDAVPAQITVTDVVNQNGRAIVYYNLPDDDNLKYIRAKYEPRPGEPSEINASFFTDSLILDGFKTEGDYVVDLYSVSSGEVSSEPVTITVSPKIPAYLYANDAANVISDFGGFRYRTVNPTNEKLFIKVFYQTPEGEWDLAYETVTEETNVEFVKRGMEAVPTMFRMQVEDRWGNISDYREFEMTPLLEVKCDKTLWQQVLPVDEFTITPYSSAHLYKAWDEVIFATEPNCFQSASSWNFASRPDGLSFTIDLGMTYHLSRMEEWSIYRTSTDYSKRYEKYFNAGDIKDFEVYGAEILDTEYPLYDEAGNLNPNWTLLFKGVNARPSGSTANTTVEPVTELEEYNYANGIPRDFSFPIEAPNVRYIKFRILSNYGNSKYIVIQEISLYGQPINN